LIWNNLLKFFLIIHDPIAISLPGVLKDLKLNSILPSNGARLRPQPNSGGAFGPGIVILLGGMNTDSLRG
jgi:hypothetical protein